MCDFRYLALSLKAFPNEEKLLIIVLAKRTDRNFQTKVETFAVTFVEKIKKVFDAGIVWHHNELSLITFQVYL